MLDDGVKGGVKAMENKSASSFSFVLLCLSSAELLMFLQSKALPVLSSPADLPLSGL